MSPPTSSTARSVVGEDHLHGLLRPLVHELVGLGRPRERDAVRDERPEEELAEQREGNLAAPPAVPTRREGGIELGDLRADETQASAMETRAQIEAHRFGAVPRAHDDGGLERGRVYREAEGARGPARLRDHLRTAAPPA